MPETIFKVNLTNNLVRKVWNFIVKENGWHFICVYEEVGEDH